MKKKINIIVNVINDCNGSCTYCYMFASRRSQAKISLERVPKLIFNSSIDFDTVEFCWHGGEPLLVGIDFYRTIVETQKELKKKREIKFVNTIQTNGTLLDDEWLSFFKENDFHIGLSFDAPPDVHFIQRPLFSKAMRLEDYLGIFRKFKKYDLPLGFLCVVTKQNVGRAKEIFDFYKSIDASSYSFLPLKEVPLLTCPPPPDNEELSQLYKETFELWTKTQNNLSNIDPLDTMIRSLLGDYPRSCSFSQCCLKRMISIMPEGYVVPCSSLLSDQFILGSIFDSSLIAILANKNTDILRKIRSSSIINLCRECEYISICRGGCREIAYWHSGSYTREYPYCSARKETFNYLRSRLENIFEKAKIPQQTGIQMASAL